MKSTVSRARRLASGSFLRTVNLVATAIVSLLITPFVIHTLGDRLYGIWALVGAFIGYYGLLELGLSTAISRYLAAALGAADHAECNRVFNTALQIYLGLGVIVLAVTGVVAALAPHVAKNPEDAALFWRVILILGLSLALMFPVKVFKGVLEAHLRFDRTATVELLELGLRTVLIVTMLLAGFKVVGLAWATFLASLPSLVLLVYYSFHDLPFLRLERSSWTRDTARKLFSYSVFSLVSNVADVLRFQIDNLIVAAYVGLAAVTHYTIAGRLADYYMGLILALFGVFRSVFSQQEGAKDYEGIKRTFLFATRISICVSSFVGFGLIAWGKLFIERWMGRPYLDAYPCLLTLVLGLMFALWQAPSIGLLYGTAKHRFLAWSSMSEGLINVVLSILLVRTYGILGVALGTAIPLSISKIIVQPVYVCKVVGINYWEYVRKVGRTVAVVAGSLVIPLFLTMKFAKPDYKMLFLGGLLSAIFYTLSLWLLEFSRQEADMVWRAIRPRPTVKTNAD